MNSGKNILVCPLDWGLGHATRMVPVIEMLERKGANVFIAADNRPLEFLAQRFPQNKTIKLRGYSPKYPTNNNMALAMLKSIPRMILETRKSNKALHKIIKEYNIDAVISDNRYELYTSKVPTVFVTHQLNIQTSGWQKIGKPIINWTINHFINKFDEIWVPDIKGKFSLSGELSRSDKFATRIFNIGFLSRFTIPEANLIPKSVDILIILSGPEPQRTILEKLLTKQALQSNLKTIILLGKPEEKESKEIKNVKLLSHVADEEFSLLIQSAEIVISRPGYSTLMDLAVIGKKAIFIPTPGQTEQEYLANKLLNDGIAFTQSQSQFNISIALKDQERFKGLLIENNPELLESRIDNLLKIC